MTRKQKNQYQEIDTHIQTHVDHNGNSSREFSHMWNLGQKVYETKSDAR